MSFEFKLHRDCDGHKFRLRKVVIELFYNGRMLDRRRCFGLFAGPLFEERLKRKMRRMLKVGKILQALTGNVD